jgi:very-short-patch-repair endonuclease
VCTISAPSDADLARLAGRLRILTLEQLLAAGLSKKAIRHRVREGRLQPLWTGIYLVGAAPPHPLSLAQGATASCAGPAWVSHRWTAYVLGFHAVPELPVDITVTGGSRHGRPGKVRVHHTTLLEPRDVTISRHGIPTTTAARAILDIAESATTTELEALIADAQVAKVLTERQLRDVLNRAGRRRGAAKVRRILSETNGLTLSEAERILRRLLKEAGLPQPITNHPIGRYRADFCWPKHELIVELDSWTYHGHRRAFKHDRKRNAELAAKGWSILPITPDQLRNEPLIVVARIAEALARRDAA